MIRCSFNSSRMQRRSSRAWVRASRERSAGRPLRRLGKPIARRASSRRALDGRVGDASSASTSLMMPSDLDEDLDEGELLGAETLEAP